MLNILFIGLESGTSLDRAHAYRRLGHRVIHLDTRKLLPATAWVDHITWKLGDQWLAALVLSQLRRFLRGMSYDLCHVDSGEWLDSKAVNYLKRHCKKVINYNIDDPTGQRDRKRFTCYREAVPAYHLLCVVRTENIPEVIALGAKDVLCVRRSADELSHAPRELTAADQQAWGSDVLFIGTWMPERGRFLKELAQRGVPLTIRGARWQKAPEWSYLRAYWKSGHIEGDAYAKAIQCAKVNIGLVSEGNRDKHTTRSAEIPALGSLLCAKRTEDHQKMYAEGVEAVFWDTASECAEKCFEALQSDALRKTISAAGRARCKKSGYFNEVICAQIIQRASV